MKYLVALTILTLSSCKVQTLFQGYHDTQYLITDSSLKTLSSENRKVRIERKANSLIVTRVGTSNSLGTISLYRIRSSSLDSSGLFTKYILRDSIICLLWPSSHVTIQHPVRGDTSHLEYYDVTLSY